jgi:hypothetical protein
MDQEEQISLLPDRHIPAPGRKRSAASRLHLTAKRGRDHPGGRQQANSLPTMEKARDDLDLQL